MSKDRKVEGDIFSKTVSQEEMVQITLAGTEALKRFNELKLELWQICAIVKMMSNAIPVEKIELIDDTTIFIEWKKGFMEWYENFKKQGV